MPGNHDLIGIAAAPMLPLFRGGEMHQVIPNKVVTIPFGVVSLTDAQARKRGENVEPIEKPGAYNVICPIQFKAGDGFGIEVVTKELESDIEIAKPARSRKKAAESESE